MMITAAKTATMITEAIFFDEPFGCSFMSTSYPLRRLPRRTTNTVLTMMCTSSKNDHSSTY